MSRSGRLVGLLLAAAAIVACRPSSPLAPAAVAATTHDDRIFDVPSEVCEGGSDEARPTANEHTCRGRPVGGALRRYRNGDAVLEAGFVPHASRTVVGEPACVTFVLRNAGPRPVRIHPDGYTTSRMGRDTLFEISAVGPGGARVLDPEDGGEPDTMGEAPIVVAPGGTYVDDLLLPEWLALGAAGTYTISAKRRTMGWDDTETAVEIQSTFEIRVEPPDPRRLATVIDRLAADLRAPRRGHRRTYARALRALISIPDPATVPYVAGALRDPVVPWYLPLHNTPGGRRVAIARLASTDPSTRSYAAALLAGMPGPEESVPALLVAVHDADPSVRISAIDALLALGQPFEVGWALSLLEGKEEDRNYQVGARLLLEHAPSQVRRILAAHLDLDDPSPENRKNCGVAAAIGMEAGARYACGEDATPRAAQIEANRRALAALRRWLSSEP